MICKYERTHSFAGEEVELQITYEYTPQSPARWSSFNPPEYSEVDVLGILIDGRTATPGEFDMVCENVRLFEELEIHGANCIEDERAAAAEYRANMNMKDE